LLCSQQATYPQSSQIEPFHVPAVTWFTHQTQSIEKEKYGIINLFLTQAFFVISVNVLLNFNSSQIYAALLQKILHVLGHTVDSCAQFHNKMYINAHAFTGSHTTKKDVAIVA
jgi:hypothetical protein